MEKAETTEDRRTDGAETTRSGNRRREENQTRLCMLYMPPSQNEVRIRATRAIVLVSCSWPLAPVNND